MKHSKARYYSENLKEHHTSGNEEGIVKKQRESWYCKTEFASVSLRKKKKKSH